MAASPLRKGISPLDVDDHRGVHNVAAPTAIEGADGRSSTGSSKPQLNASTPSRPIPVTRGTDVGPALITAAAAAPAPSTSTRRRGREAESAETWTAKSSKAAAAVPDPQPAQKSLLDKENAVSQPAIRRSDSCAARTALTSLTSAVKPYPRIMPSGITVDEHMVKKVAALGGVLYVVDDPFPEVTHCVLGTSSTTTLKVRAPHCSHTSRPLHAAR